MAGVSMTSTPLWKLMPRTILGNGFSLSSASIHRPPQTVVTQFGQTRVAIVDGGGANTFRRALAFQSLGYRTSVLCDSDVQSTPDLETTFGDSGGKIFDWREGNAVEDELFLSLSDEGVGGLLVKAIEYKEEELVNEHIKSASENETNLQQIQTDGLVEGYSTDNREISRKRLVRKMANSDSKSQEAAGQGRYRQDLANANPEFVNTINRHPPDDGLRSADTALVRGNRQGRTIVMGTDGRRAVHAGGFRVRNADFVLIKTHLSRGFRWYA